MYRKYFKRPMDCFFALAALILLSPVVVISAFILLFQNKGKVFFLQPRPGRNQKSFNIIKFKSMTDARDASGNLLPDNERITRFGSFIRKTSIDELPQLFNIVFGDMSFVGPRPLLFKYIPLYNERQIRRHEERPGITGLAQIMGRNSISWMQKFEYDIQYIENITLWGDMKIFFTTMSHVVKRKDVNQSDSRPMEPFNGSN